MTNDIICGKFYVQDKEYPFFLSGQVITVVQVAHEYNSDFIDDYHFEYLEGITDRGKYIYLLDCNVYGGPIVGITTNLYLSCKGYILSNSQSDYFDCIEFYSPALNAFYSPRQAVSVERDAANMHTLSLRFKNHEDVSKNFICSINGESINCSLSFQSTVTLRPEDTSPASTNTTLSMKFSSPHSIKELGKHYLYLLDFLAFINFRSDIPIDKIVLYKKEDQKLICSGTAKIFQQDCSGYSVDTTHNITYWDFSGSSLAAPFTVVAERRAKGTYNPFFIPSDSKDATYVDSAKWLIAAISFEGEFNQSYPGFKYENDENFCQAKELLLDCIDSAIDSSGLSKNHKSNQNLKSFRRLIEMTDTTVKEKFKLCLRKYSSEITPIAEKHSRANGVSTSVDFAQAYSDYRNNIAHGTILPISNVEIVTYQILRGFIYILILERAGVPPQKIKEIVSKLF